MSKIRQHQIVRSRRGYRRETFESVETLPSGTWVFELVGYGPWRVTPEDAEHDISTSIRSNKNGPEKEATDPIPQA